MYVTTELEYLVLEVDFFDEWVLPSIKPSKKLKIKEPVDPLS